MTPNQFYADLVQKVGVEKSDMDDARAKRDELRETLEEVVGRRIPGTRTFPAGALAQGTQIAPLNDVDVVVEAPEALDEWKDDPCKAMEDVLGWLKPEIPGSYELSAHAIKITFPDEDFTADVVVGIKQSKGILLPHCPKDEPHKWIASHPEEHSRLVRERNKKFSSSGNAHFSREIRILKHLNRRWQIQNDLPRKPLASFHVTALALKILDQALPHEHWTPAFLAAASKLVLAPLEDPTGVGDPLEAKDPALASRLCADAAEKTARALQSSDAEAEKILKEVFGDPDQLRQLIGGGAVSVGSGGSLIVGVSGTRVVKPVRSHGDGG